MFVVLVYVNAYARMCMYVIGCSCMCGGVHGCMWVCPSHSMWSSEDNVGIDSLLQIESWVDLRSPALTGGAHTCTNSFWFVFSVLVFIFISVCAD